MFKGYYHLVLPVEALDDLRLRGTSYCIVFHLVKKIG